LQCALAQCQTCCIINKIWQNQISVVVECLQLIRRKNFCRGCHEPLGFSKLECSGNAAGNKMLSGVGVPSTSTSKFAPPCSHNSWRHRPHGVTSVSLPTHATAMMRPPPPMWSAPKIAHSAHKVSPYDAFSTLHPEMMRPSSMSAAAPTRNFEYGAYECCCAARAAVRSVCQSIGCAGVAIRQH